MRKILMLGAAVLFSTVFVSEAAITGKVSNQAGKPIANATVELLGQGLKVTSGTDGAYSIPTTGAAVPLYVPQTEKISLNRGILELSLANTSPVRLSIFDVKGNLLKNESLPNAPAGIYHLNIAENSRATNMLIINAAIGSRMVTFRHLPLNNGRYAVNALVESSAPVGGRLAKIAVVSDSLKATANGYSAKTVKISSYDTTVAITLDSADGCPHAALKGKDICTIGDSWIQMPGNQVTRLQELMQKAGVIGPGDTFDRREVSGTTLSTIIASYNRNTKVKILIMDGGGIDLFGSSHASQSKIDQVVRQFKDFLQKVKTDGNVEHIIYSLYPVIPTTPWLNADMGPGFTEACKNSPVDCHLVDLEPLFKGQHIAGDRTHADNAGGVIIGEAWWKAMRENCIGQ